MNIVQKVKRFLRLPNTGPALIIAGIVGLILALVVPLLPHIPGHPDEHQFFNNAWSIMGGQALHNYLHVAVTEYLLAFYLSFVNIVTRSGVNFPQGFPTEVTYYYGRTFGLILWLLTYMVGVFLLQKEKTILRPSVVFFTVLYFGSIGLFERFLRVNSDSMAIFVFANYLFISLIYHRRKATALKFFLINVIFIFLMSFTNLKGMYLLPPIVILNTLLPFLFYEKRKEGEIVFPKIYRLIFYTLGIIFLSVILWYVLIPKPVDPKTFWYNIKQATVASVIFDYQYPGVAHHSWAVYLYDLLVFQVGISQVFAILIFTIVAFVMTGRRIWNNLKTSALALYTTKLIRNGDVFPYLELILFFSLITYYVGISSVVIHWSRWGAPLGFLLILLLSSYLEKVYLIFVASSFFKRRFVWLIFPILFLISWSVMFMLLATIKLSDYPTGHGYNLLTRNFDSFLKEQKIPDEKARDRVGWFMTSLDNVRAPNFDITTLGKEGSAKIDYLVWPQWGTNILYSKDNVDLEIHNIKAFIKKYTNGIIWRFPSPISYYTHYTKLFAQGILGITWFPEIEAMTETDYGILKMKHVTEPMRLRYVVPYEGMEHYYSPSSKIFSLRNLQDSNIVPPCHGSPTTLDVSTGEPSPPADELLVSRITDMYCHSLGIRIAFKGKVLIRIEGLPADPDGIQKVYSAYPMTFDPITKTMIHTFEDTKITAAFGVATKEKYLPNLKFYVEYVPDVE